MQELHTWIGATDPTSQAFRLQNQNLEQLGYTVVLHQTQHKEGDIDTSRRETEGAAGRTVDPTTPHRESKKVKDLHSRSTQSERLDKDGDARRAENLHNTKLLRKLASRQERRRNQEAYCDPDYKSSAENKANSCQHTISSPPRKSKPSKPRKETTLCILHPDHIETREKTPIWGGAADPHPKPNKPKGESGSCKTQADPRAEPNKTREKTTLGGGTTDLHTNRPNTGAKLRQGRDKRVREIIQQGQIYYKGATLTHSAAKPPTLTKSIKVRNIKGAER